MNLTDLRSAVEERHLPTWKKDFWSAVENVREGLSAAIGLYVFFLQHGENKKPWYVGKTSGKGGFKTEIFQNQKVDHYLSVVDKRGSAQMVFFPLLTESGKISRNASGKAKAIDWVEKRMISFALERNAELLNVKDTSFSKSVFVPGIIGTRRRGAPAQDAKLARAILHGERE